MSKNSKPPRKVGYGVPPKHSQFPKGKSGNTAGRPKGSKNFSTVIEAELNARMPVTEQGKRKKISKRAVIAKQLVNKGAGGDAKAISLLLNHDRLREGISNLIPVTTELTDEKDKSVMESIVSRILKMHGVETPSNTTDETPPEDASVTLTSKAKRKLT